MPKTKTTETTVCVTRDLPPQRLLCSILGHVDLFVFIIQKIHRNVGIQLFGGLAEDFVSHGLRTV